VTPRRRSSSLPAWTPGALRLRGLLPEVGLIGHVLPLMLLLSAIVAPGAWGWAVGLPRLGPGEAVWLAGPPHVELTTWGVAMRGAGAMPDGVEIERELAAVARRGDRTGLVLAVERDVPYARVLDVVEAARAAGVRRMYLVASDAPP
jgi:hypothetical protein